jgi:pilus assembly protein Flp/PilA
VVFESNAAWEIYLIEKSSRYIFPRARHQPEETKVTYFFHDETGEYGLIAAGISVAIIAVVGSVGSSLNTTYTSVQTALR